MIILKIIVTPSPQKLWDKWCKISWHLISLLKLYFFVFILSFKVKCQLYMCFNVMKIFEDGDMFYQKLLKFM
jgi:hypothetical protein